MESLQTDFHALSLLRFPLLHFPPMRSAPAFSTPAFSTPAFSAPPPDAAIHDPVGQASTFVLSYREGRQQNGSYTCFSIHYFWTATRLQTTSRSTMTNLASYTIEQDLRPLNIGLVSAWQRAQDRVRWKRTVETAKLQAWACS